MNKRKINLMLSNLEEVKSYIISINLSIKKIIKIDSNILVIHTNKKSFQYSLNNLIEL